MNKLYKIKSAVDTIETGSGFPATISYDNYDFDAANSVYKIPFQQQTNIKHDLRFKLKPNCNATNLLSNATFKTPGLLIDSKFLEVIKNFNIINHQLLDVDIYNIRSNRAYYWLHFTWTNWMNYVSWNESEFEIFENGSFKPIKINNYHTYFNEVFKSEYFRVACRNPVLKPIEFDLYCHPFIGETLVSKRLKEQIENAKLTGIDFVENTKQRHTDNMR